MAMMESKRQWKLYVAPVCVYGTPCPTCFISYGKLVLHLCASQESIYDINRKMTAYEYAETEDV
jgi:hypothetical protein